MSAYRGEELDSRISGMAGDPAEDAFRRYMATKNYREGEHYERSGWDRTDTGTAFLATLPPTERYRPDFVQIGGHWWECQGFGAEGIVRFKKEKLEVLWDHYAQRGEANRQVRFFLYDSSRDRAMVMPIQMVLWAINQPQARYDEKLLDGKKAGWEVPLWLLRQRLLTDCFDHLKSVTNAARKERDAVDEQAAAATRRAMRAAGLTPPSTDGV
jgi:hypothetical protein